jgi:CspA family cold shock protein
MRGTVIRKRSEGYGFIKPDDGSKDVFFHATAVVEGSFDELQEGDAVTFDVEEGQKGPAATNVKPAASAPAEPASDDEASATEEEAA